MLIGRLMQFYYQQISNCCRPVLIYWLRDWHHQWLTDSVWVAKSCITVCFTYSLRTAIFLNIDISRGSAATRLKCGGVFKYDCVTNFLLNLIVKKNWKSLNISWSYRQEFSVLFFDSQCTSFIQNEISHNFYRNMSKGYIHHSVNHSLNYSRTVVL